MTQTITWHKYPQEKPTENEKWYLATFSFGKEGMLVHVSYYDIHHKFTDEVGNSYDRFVLAWAEMPKPYGEVT